MLQRRLAEMRDLGKVAVAMEVSSHSLDQYRVGGTYFAAGIFTNLSQDHLDYHRTMEAYFASKARLFTSCNVPVAVVNRADPWGVRLVEMLSGADVRLVTFAPSDATEIALGQRSSSFSWQGGRLELQMPGRFNIANAVAAATAAQRTGSELGCHKRRAGVGPAGAGQVRGGGRGPTLHCAGRLRPHSGGARRGVAGGPGPRQQSPSGPRPGACDRGFRCRR